MTRSIDNAFLREALLDIPRWAHPAPAITVDERKQRLARARQLMVQAGVDSLLIGAGQSLRYFTGISWGMIERLLGMVLTLEGDPVLICPAFEAGSLDAAVEIDVDVRLWQEHESPYDLVAGVLRENGSRKLAIDPALPFTMVDALKHATRSVSFVNAASIVDGCRMLKSSAELALMRQAKQMTLEVQRRAQGILHKGIAASTVRRYIDEAHRAIGSEGSTFCIVLFGPSTAYPHGLPSDDVLAQGDMVLIDTGCAVQGYNSDITRSYVFGEPTRLQRDMWNLEKEAQQAAFDAARPGEPCERADQAARAVVERAGLGPDYQLPGVPHRTGHGIGLSVHEAPYLVRGDRTEMQPGMCFSNEPMIVVPGEFGVRLEDHFFVTATGAEWFTERSASIDKPFS
ncbi:Xaa-Pro dipeptidase [Luteibacter rhizovicinus]|uniref:Xaa-Pro dipeptidase n=1 Tax=Luteibacter rhizovicinus TaxID=242606 RepID=A0A4R3YPA7_9GAMM|nr:Xaa-Pro peptidase family protein [Luteibacter rhizovicinus]TCV93398.1 Xaa-Pro dipeptidase [Luteibacter rhizovicinus]